MGKKYIDLTPEAIKTIKQAFEDAAGKTSAALNKMVDALNKLAEEARYERINKVVKESGEDIDKALETINKELTNWAGNSGFKVMTEKMEAGDSAISTAKSLDEAIKASAVKAKPTTAIEPCNDTSSPKCSDETLTKLAEIYKQCSTEISAATNDAKTKIQEKSKDDVTFGIVLAPVTLMCESFASLTSGLNKRVKNLEEEVRGKERAQGEATRTAVSDAKKTSSSASSIADALKMFDSTN